MKSFNVFFLLSSGIATFLLGFPQGSAMAGEECRDIIQNKCASCHFVKYICPKVEQGKGTMSWKWTIHDMVKEGMVATGQEQDRLVGCLADPDAKVKEFCTQKK